MKKKFNQAKYIQEFEKENYDRVLVRLPKGTKEKIKVAANNNSINSYIVNLIEEDLKKGIKKEASNR